MEARKLLINQFVKKTVWKIIVFVIVMIFIAAIHQAITPIISNDIAMGQMENSDELYVMMEMYNKLKPIVDLAYIVAIIWFGSVIVRDTSKFAKAIKTTEDTDNVGH